MDNPDILKFLLSESANANCIVDTDKIIESLQEIQNKTDYLTFLAVNESKDSEYFEEFRTVLQHDFLTFDIFLKQLETLNNDKKAYFELGKLYGTLQLCSRICYDKIKSTYQTDLIEEQKTER